jgi:hypothetical protein
MSDGDYVASGPLFERYQFFTPGTKSSTIYNMMAR